MNVENYTLRDDREADDQGNWMTLRDRIRILPVIKLARRAAFEMSPAKLGERVIE